MALLSDAAFENYKRKLVPVLYDWFMHYHLSCPTQTCRWGPKLEELGYKAKYRAYLSEQEVEDGKPNTLILAHIDVYRPHVSSCEAVSNWQEKSTSPHVHIVKTIYHPGEVNKVRELPLHPQLLVTHTDSPQLYLWNIDKQPDRRPASAGLGAKVRSKSLGSDKSAPASTPGPGSSWTPSTPDLILTGHEKNAPFPLACSSGGALVGSGGEDALVLVWDLQDTVTGLGSGAGSGAAGEGAGAGGGRKGAPELKARHRLQGHTDTLGDLVFQPGSASVLMSVADDGRIITWDLRSGSPKVAVVEAAHGRGVNVMCLDWSALDEHMVVTGAQGGSVQVWDRRRMAAASDRQYRFDAHRNAAERDIIHVEWHPTSKNVFASGSEDHTVAIWDLSRTPISEAAAAPAAASAADTVTAAPAGDQPDSETVKGSGPSSVGGGTVGDGGVGGAASAAAAAAALGRKRTRSSGAREEAVTSSGGGGGAGAGGATGGGAGGKGGKGGGKGAGEGELPQQLIFQHFGHRLGRITDFQWLPSEPWTLMSVSDHSGISSEDEGSLQVWRPIDLLYMPEEEAMAELEQHRQFILRGSKSSPPKPTPRKPTPPKFSPPKDKAQDKAQDKEQSQAPEAMDVDQAPVAVEVKQQQAA